MSKHVFSASDNTHRLTVRAYEAFGFTLGVFIDPVDAPGKGYGEDGGLIVALGLDEAKNLRDLLDIAIEEASK